MLSVTAAARPTTITNFGTDNPLQNNTSRLQQMRSTSSCSEVMSGASQLLNNSFSTPSDFSLLNTLVEGGAMFTQSDNVAVESNPVPVGKQPASSNYDAMKMRYARNDVDLLSNFLLELYTEETKGQASEQLLTCTTIYDAAVQSGVDDLLAMESFAASLRYLVDEKVIIVKEAASLKIIKTEINYFLTALNGSAMFNKLDSGVKAVINQATAAVKVNETPLSELASLRTALETVFIDAQAVITKEWARSPSEEVAKEGNSLDGKSLKNNKSRIFGKITKLLSSSKTLPPSSPKSPVSTTSRFYAEVTLPTATTPVNVTEDSPPPSPAIKSAEPIYATVTRRNPPSAPKAVETTDL